MFKLPDDDEKAFDQLFDLAEEYTSEEDLISLFAAYFSETGGEDFEAIATEGLSGLDAELVNELVVEMGHPLSMVEEAMQGLVELTAAVYADAAEDEEEEDED